MPSDELNICTESSVHCSTTLLLSPLCPRRLSEPLGPDKRGAGDKTDPSHCDRSASRIVEGSSAENPIQRHKWGGRTEGLVWWTREMPGASGVAGKILANATSLHDTDARANAARRRQHTQKGRGKQRGATDRAERSRCKLHAVRHLQQVNLGATDRNQAQLVQVLIHRKEQDSAAAGVAFSARSKMEALHLRVVLCLMLLPQT